MNTKLNIQAYFFSTERPKTHHLYAFNSNIEWCCIASITNEDKFNDMCNSNA
jgi:hypothetical protein